MLAATANIEASETAQAALSEAPYTRRNVRPRMSENAKIDQKRTSAKAT